MLQSTAVPSATILLIEADPSLQRLMTLGLQHSGMQVISSSSLEDLSALDIQKADLLVLDIDCGRSCNWSLLTRIQTHPHLTTLPLIVLAWDTAPDLASSSPTSVDLLQEDQPTFLAKPFDARALHRTIQHLLAQKAAQQAAREAQLEATLLASYTRHTAPSIWPVITAAGLLLVVLGMLFQLVLTIVGALIVVVALLLWTIGGAGAPSYEAPAVAFNVPHK